MLCLEVTHTRLCLLVRTWHVEMVDGSGPQTSLIL
nr:MAG TPA: hypothetical protein [Caudoviricetes sp.]